MGETIQVRRGPQSRLPELANGEIALTTDTKDVYIGTPTGNELVGGKSISSQLAETTQITGVSLDSFDGVTDDQKFQNALTYAQTNQVIIKVPERKVTLANTYTIPPFPFVLRLSAPSRKAEIHYSGVGNLFEMPNSGDGSRIKYQFDIDTITFSTINGQRAFNMGNNVYLGSAGTTFSNCLFTGWKDTALVLRDVWRLRLLENEFMYNNNCLSLNGSNGSTLHNNRFFTNTGYGVKIEGQSFALNFNGNLFEDLSKEAIIFAGDCSGFLGGNYFESCGTTLTGDDANMVIRIGDSQHGGNLNVTTFLTLTGNRSNTGQKTKIFNGQNINFVGHMMDIVIPDTLTNMSIKNITIVGDDTNYRSISIGSAYKGEVIKVNELYKKGESQTISFNNVTVPGSSYTVVRTMQVRYGLDVYGAVSGLAASETNRIGIVLWNKTDNVSLFSTWLDSTSKYLDYFNGNKVKPIYSTTFSAVKEIEIRIYNDFTTEQTTTCGHITFGAKHYQ